jgi:hypothetical protein
LLNEDAVALFSIRTMAEAVKLSSANSFHPLTKEANVCSFFHERLLGKLKLFMATQ